MALRFLLGILLLLSISTEAADSTPTHSVHLLKIPSSGAYLRPFLGVNWNLIDDTSNLESAAGPGAGLAVEYYFDSSSGIYASANAFYGKRLGTDEAVNWSVASAGATFQFHLFHSDLVTTFGVGGYVAFPISDFARAGSRVNFTAMPGAELRLAQFFPIYDNFDLGLSSEIQVPVQALFGRNTGPHFLAVQVGLTARAHL